MLNVHVHAWEHEPNNNTTVKGYEVQRMSSHNSMS